MFFFKIEHEFVVDACMEEEFCTDGQILVAINGDGNISGIQRLGSSAVEPELLAEMLEVEHFASQTLSFHAFINSIRHACTSGGCRYWKIIK